MRYFGSVMVTVFVMFAQTAVAENENVAIIIANENYRYLDNAEGSKEALETADKLEDAGFEVFVVKNLNQRGVQKASEEILDIIEPARRVLFFVSGHMVSTGYDNVLLNTDAYDPNIFSAYNSGLSVNSIMSLAAAHSGAAVVIVGKNRTEIEVGSGITYGYSPNRVPNGVTLITGPTTKLVDVVNGPLMQPGNSYSSIARETPSDVKLYGLVSPFNSFIAKGEITDPKLRRKAQKSWASAQKDDSIEAYEEIIEQYGDTFYAEMAQERIEEIVREKNAAAKQAEEELGLTLEDRKDIQGKLTLLGFDTRGIDGIFGRGSRTALTKWQEKNGFETTAFLNTEQLNLLRKQSEKRREQIEAEDRDRRKEMEQVDRQYWEQNGSGETEAGIRKYLQTYPDGLFADEAKQRLEFFAEQALNDAQAVDRQAWDRARATHTERSYRTYLDEFPNGVFSEEARRRIEIFSTSTVISPQVQAAMDEEKNIVANSSAWMLVERRLNKQGLEPGDVDGVPDETTRRAIRRFQRVSGLPVTGYVTQETMVRLLLAGN